MLVDPRNSPGSSVRCPSALLQNVQTARDPFGGLLGESTSSGARAAEESQLEATERYAPAPTVSGPPTPLRLRGDFRPERRICFHRRYARRTGSSR